VQRRLHDPVQRRWPSLSYEIADNVCQRRLCHGHAPMAKHAESVVRNLQAVIVHLADVQTCSAPLCLLSDDDQHSIVSVTCRLSCVRHRAMGRPAALRRHISRYSVPYRLLRSSAVIRRHGDCEWNLSTRLEGWIARTSAQSRHWAQAWRTIADKRHDCRR
jgi:hypothetical protein